MPSEPIRSVLPRELASLPALTRIIDVREPEEFQGPLGHLPRAELVPLATLPGTVAQWARNEPLLLVCRSGTRSLKAAQLLAALGFTCLSNLTGGMIAVNASLPDSGAGSP